MVTTQPPSVPTQRYVVAYLLLAVAGWAGAHRHYLGWTRSAIAQGILSIGSVVVGVTISDPVGFAMFCGAILWMIADIGMIPVMARRPSDKTDSLMGAALPARPARAELPGPPAPGKQLTDEEYAAFDRLLDQADELTDDESVVLALHRLRREVHLILEQRLDPDIAGEFRKIVTEDAPALVRTYAASRRSDDADRRTRIDELAREAVERLAVRVRELRGDQCQRHLDGLDTTGRYIRSRNPIAADDPFGRIG